MKLSRAARRGAVGCACAQILFAAGSNSCAASDRTWLNASTGFFSTPGEWSGSAVPGTGDNARFTASGTYGILFATNPTNVLASFSDGDVTFGLGGETYTLTSTGTTSLVVGNRGLFPVVVSKLTLTGGTLSSVAAVVGTSAPGPGIVNLNSGATWTCSGRLSVGLAGAGTVLINSGGVLRTTAGDNALADTTGGSGYVLVAAGGQWVSTGNIRVGDGGAGTLVIDSGSLSSTGSLFVAPASGSSGYVSLANSGSMSFQGDAIIDAGSISVTSGTAAFHIVEIGALSGGIGTLAVAGGTTHATSNTYVGGGDSGSISSGVLTVSAGTFTTDGLLKNWPTGTIHLSGGTLSAGSFDLNTGSFDWTGGTLKSTGNLTIGPGGACNALAIPANGSLDCSFMHDLTVAGSLSSGIGASVTAGRLICGSVGSPGSISLVQSGVSLGAGIGVESGTVILDHCTSASLGSLNMPAADYIGTGADSASVVLRGGRHLTAGNFFESGTTSVYPGAMAQIDQGGSWIFDETGLPGSGFFAVAPGGTLIIATGGNLASHTVIINGIGTVSDSGSKLVAVSLTLQGEFTDTAGAYVSTTDLNVTGTEMIGAGGSLVCNACTVGGSQSNATLAITGTSASFSCATPLSVGQLGPATLSLGTGATLSAPSINVGLSGKLIMSGGALLTGSINFKGGAGTFSADPDSSNVGTLAMISGDPASRITFSSKAHIGMLTLTSGRADQVAGSDALLAVHNLSIDTTDGAALDLMNNKAIIDYSTATPFSTIRSLILAGRNGGSWDGPGITSTSAASTNGATAIGYAEAFALFNTFPNTFGGESIDSSAVLIRYTYGGDANLDGAVDTADFTRLANHFDSTTTLWSDGDFNYDGVVNALDFNALATNFGRAMSSPSLSLLVPEPAALVYMSLAASSLLGRRGRSHRAVM